MKLEEFCKYLVINIKKARWASGLTQEQVAEKGLSYKHYQEIESGKRLPTIKTLLQLAGIFKTTVSELTTVPPYKREPNKPFLGELDVIPPKPGRKAKKNKRE